MNSSTSPWKRRQSSTHQPATQSNPPQLSRWSSPAVPNSAWCSSNFLLGAGMVVIQPSTNKIVVVQDTVKNYWFFPRGRKDLGESLEVAALREAYEESGYHVQFMPVYSPSRAPAPPNQQTSDERPNTEPIYITTSAYTESRPRLTQDPDAHRGYEYLTSWYIGQIADDAVPERGTGMADEQNYISHLLTLKDALEKVWGVERLVLKYAWAVYLQTLGINQAIANRLNGGREEAEHGDETSGGI